MQAWNQEYQRIKRDIESVKLQIPLLRPGFHTSDQIHLEEPHKQLSPFTGKLGRWTLTDLEKDFVFFTHGIVLGKLHLRYDILLDFLNLTGYTSIHPNIQLIQLDWQIFQDMGYIADDPQYNLDYLIYLCPKVMWADLLRYMQITSLGDSQKKVFYKIVWQMVPIIDYYKIAHSGISNKIFTVICTSFGVEGNTESYLLDTEWNYGDRPYRVVKKPANDHIKSIADKVFSGEIPSEWVSSQQSGVSSHTENSND